MDKKSREKSKTRPRFVKQDQVCIARLRTTGTICLEEFPQMGRFTLRDEGTVSVQHCFATCLNCIADVKSTYYNGPHAYWFKDSLHQIVTCNNQWHHKVKRQPSCNDYYFLSTQIVIIEHKSIICPGYNAVLHIHTCIEVQITPRSLARSI